MARRIGTNGKDTIIADQRGEVIRAKGGNDFVLAGGGDDRVYGGGGDDNLSGDSGEDVVRGQRGDDALFGDGGADVLYGGSGADQLRDFGGGGDRYYGGRGRDDILVDSGHDHAWGGAGADRFDLLVGDGAGRSKVKLTVEDFEVGVDTIGVTERLSIGEYQDAPVDRIVVRTRDLDKDGEADDLALRIFDDGSANGARLDGVFELLNVSAEELVETAEQIFGPDLVDTLFI